MNQLFIILLTWSWDTVLNKKCARTVLYLVSAGWVKNGEERIGTKSCIQFHWILLNESRCGNDGVSGADDGGKGGGGNGNNGDDDDSKNGVNDGGDGDNGGGNSGDNNGGDNDGGGGHSGDNDDHDGGDKGREYGVRQVPNLSTRNSVCI